MTRKPFLFLAPVLFLAGCFLPPPAGMAPVIAPTPTPLASGGATPVPAPTSPGDRPSPPPWFVPSDGLTHLAKAGLEPLASEGDKYHIHAHLSVFWDRAPVVVPANIGIDPQHIWISPLHTHTADGIVHVEANVQSEIKLAQFFAEWNVPLTGAAVYDDGKPVADGPNLVLRDYQAITVVWGAPPDRIPDRYPGPPTTTPVVVHSGP